MKTEDFWEKANLAALFCLYIYSAQELKIENQNTIKETTEKSNEKILKAAIENNPTFANSIITDLSLSENGMSACCAINPHGDVYVIFRGTGNGEWIDNGEGLSGIPEENTYFTYKNQKIIKRTIISKDFATDQQAEALNWFNKIADKNQWKPDTKIYICGHSKGGNKAQFVFLKSGMGEKCFSFCGQGFSPEALKAFKWELKDDFQKRSENIFSISAENDYVNVLGKRAMPKSNIIYLKSIRCFHSMKCLIDANGKLNPKTYQGRFSQYAQSISEDLMDMPPFIRKYATLGIMNLFQKYLGGTPVNDDSVSFEETIAGIALSVPSILNFRNRKY